MEFCLLVWSNFYWMRVQSICDDRMREALVVISFVSAGKPNGINAVVFNPYNVQVFEVKK